MHRHRRLTAAAALAAAAIGALAACGEREERAAPPPPATTTERPAEEASASGCPVRPVPYITSRGVEPALLGARLADIAARCPVRDTALSLGEGLPEEAWTVGIAGVELVVLTTGTRDSTVTRVIVPSAGFQTEKGLGIWSTVGDLRAAYGALHAGIGEGTLAVWSDSLPGVSFGLGMRPSALPAGGRGVERDASIIPDTARVVQVWVYAP